MRGENASGRMHESELARIRQEKKVREKRARVKSVEERIEELLSRPIPMNIRDFLPDSKIDAITTWENLAIARGRYITDLHAELRPLIAELVRERGARRRGKVKPLGS